MFGTRGWLEGGVERREEGQGKLAQGARSSFLAGQATEQSGRVSFPCLAFPGRAAGVSPARLPALLPSEILLPVAGS